GRDHQRRSFGGLIPILPELARGEGPPGRSLGGGGAIRLRIPDLRLHPSVSRWRGCHLPEASSGRIVLLSLHPDRRRLGRFGPGLTLPGLVFARLALGARPLFGRHDNDAARPPAIKAGVDLGRVPPAAIEERVCHPPGWNIKGTCRKDFSGRRFCGTLSRAARHKDETAFREGSSCRISKAKSSSSPAPAAGWAKRRRGRWRGRAPKSCSARGGSSGCGR